MISIPRGVALLALMLAGPMAGVAGAQTAAATAPPPAQASGQPQAPASPDARGLHRWLDLQVISLDTRYRFIDTSEGVHTFNQMQHRQTVKLGVKLDPAGHYSVQFGLGSGTNFTASWEPTGIGTGDGDWHPYIRQLYAAAAPGNGLELQVGGLSTIRGESSEITTYDNDGYVVGERISVKRPKDLYLDEISLTVGHLGDINTPNVFDRFDETGDHDYEQALVAKRITKRVSASLDWTHALHDDTLRQAIRVGLKETRVVDAARLEVYERVTGVTGRGLAATLERALTKKLALSGGYATIDRNNPTLNGDRYLRGQRVFLEGRYALLPELTLSTFYTRAFKNDFVVPNRTRFDLVLAYNVVRALQRGHLW
jgi:hypothetical protein